MGDQIDDGRSLRDGLSSASPIEPLRVSPVPASIPRVADSIFRAGTGATVEVVDRFLSSARRKTRSRALLNALSELDDLMQMVADETRKPIGIAGYADAFAESKRLNGIAAKAIEARSGETGTGSIRQDESAVPERHSPERNLS